MRSANTVGTARSGRGCSARATSLQGAGPLVVEREFILTGANVSATGEVTEG